MFDQMVVSGKNVGGPSKSYAFVVGLVQCAIVGVLILIPLIYTQALPKGMLYTFLVAPAPPPPPPPPPAVIRKRIVVTPQRMVAPTMIPKKVAVIKDEAPDVGAGVVGGVAGMGGLDGGLGGPSGPAPPPKIAAPTRIRVGGNVAAAKLVNQVQPVYPAIARTAHVSGTVMLHAIIAKDGSIQELEYVSGPALLMKAAMDAVHQWRYQPTLLNGEPVEVDTSIQVVFTLGGE